jgi:hypothetical protein
VSAAPDEAIETAFLEPEVVLYDDRSKAVVRLNPAASAVWLLLDGRTPPAGIAAELAEIVGAPPEQLLPDVEAAIAQFAEQHLLAGSADHAALAEVAALAEGVAPAADEVPVLARPPDP